MYRKAYLFFTSTHIVETKIMGFFKEIFMEGLNGLSLASIKLYLFQLLLCGFLAIVTNFLFRKKYNRKISFPSVSVALSLGILVPFVKYSTPLAILTLGVLLLLSKGNAVKKPELPYLILTLLTVIAVSAGFYVFATVGFTIGAVFLILSDSFVEESE